MVIVSIAALIGLIATLAWPGKSLSNTAAPHRYGKDSEGSASSALGRDDSTPAVGRVIAPGQVVANGLTLEDYQKRWNDSLTSTADENSRFFNQLGLATAMAMKGYSEQAMELIRLAYGPGRRRCDLIQTVFRSGQDLDVTKSIYKSLEYNDEMKAACDGIGWQLSLSVAPGRLDLEKFSFLGDRLDSMLAAFVERSVVQSLKSSSEEASKAFQDAYDLPLSKDSAKTTFLKLYALVPFDSWDKLSEGSFELSDAQRQDVIAQMVSADPLKAMRKLVGTKGGEGDLTNGVQQWLEIDASQPIEWLQKNSVNLTTSQKDHAVRGIAEYSAKQGDSAVARQWVGQITDPELKKKAEKQVLFAEQEIARRNGAK